MHLQKWKHLYKCGIVFTKLKTQTNIYLNLVLSIFKIANKKLYTFTITQTKLSTEISILCLKKICFSLGLKFLNIICKDKWYFLFTFYANIFQDLNMA